MEGVTIANPPRIELISAAASPEEAAAIVAALERFLAETTAAARASEPSPWQRAGLIEGVSAKRHALPPDPGSGLPFA